MTRAFQVMFVVELEVEQDFPEGSLTLGSHWSLLRCHVLASLQPLLWLALRKAALFILEILSPGFRKPEQGRSCAVCDQDGLSRRLA